MNNNSSSLKDLTNQLRSKLELPLPAEKAHQKVMGDRKTILQMGEDKLNNAKSSAVLILIYPKQGVWHTVFILRSTYKGVHSAQIGFPGGKVEPNDDTLIDTALREANEELRIKKGDVKVLGGLTPIYVPPSNFLVNPFVAVQNTEPTFIPDNYEVSKIIECPIHNLIGEDKLISTEVVVNKNRLKVKGYQLEDKIVWGATGMIVKELAEILTEIILPNGLR